MASSDKSSKNSLAMRRKPVQQRGHDRIELIIEATERMILERGLLNLSIREIARQSNTNVATIYQFFPNRESVTRYVVEKYNSELGTALAEVVKSSSHTELPAALKEMQECIFRFYEDKPITQKIWPAVHADEKLAQLDIQDSRDNAELLTDLFLKFYPAAPRQIANSIALYTATTSSQIYRTALHENNAERKRLLDLHLTAISAITAEWLSK